MIHNFAILFHGAAWMFFILLCVRLRRIRRRNEVVGFLFWVMAGFAALLTKDFIDMGAGAWWYTRYVGGLSLGLDLCMVPVVVAYMFKILSPATIDRRRACLMALPSVLLLGAVAVTASETVFKVLAGWSILVGVAGATLTVTASLRYDRYVKENFSSTARRSVGWLRGVIFSLVIMGAVWGGVAWVKGWTAYLSYYIFLISIWTVVYRFSLRHLIIPDMPDMLLPGSVPAANGYSEQMVRRLEDCMERERPWLDPALTLNELALRIDTNRTYLSGYLNNVLGTTFYDYLNAARVGEACRLLLRTPVVNLEEVAEQCGFNSLSTFRRSFEKMKGCTPAHYRKTGGAVQA